MDRRWIKNFSCLALSLLCANAADIAIDFTAGTVGAGVGATTALSESMNAKVNITGF